MITLITGLPGAGKTLYALSRLVEESSGLASSGRQIFVDGVTDLKREDWLPINGAEWMQAPEGAVILIDECQRVFRPRGVGSKVPEHVAALETHRHKGLDFYLITQHPKLLDSNVRRLCGRHFHVVRTFGMQRATVHEWGEVSEDPDKGRGDSIRHEFSYPKDVFGLYKSAEIHTHKARIPARLYFLFALPVMLALIVYAAYSVWYKPRFSEPSPVEAAQAPAEKKTAPQVSPVKSDSISPESRARWVEERQPRITGMQWTAPIYDSVTAPVDAPRPAACVSGSSGRCSCFSQQATRLDVPEALCLQFVEKGYFHDWKDAPVGSSVPVEDAPRNRRRSLNQPAPLQNGFAS